MDGDSQAYIAFPHHRKWFNKLWFSEKMGYRCGPCGLEVQKQGWYITRPIINLSGMSVGAKKKFLEIGDLEHINVEFIDDKPIKVHLRRSPDPDFDILIPIWADEHFLVDKYKEMGYSIIFSYDDADGHLDVARIAFAVKNKKECNMQVMEVSDRDYFAEVKDRHGASAYVFIEPDNQHRIVYKDKSGMEFFHEEYAHCSIELVERAAIDWATGKRSLV